MFARKDVMKVLFVVALVVLLFYLGKYCSNDVAGFEGLEGQEDVNDIETEESVVEAAPKQAPMAPAPQQEGVVSPSSPLGENEVFMPVGETSSPYGLTGGKVPTDCFPKDQLNPDELLPGNAATKFAASNPKAQGELKDQNFLEAGYHVGVNTVGQTLRNANRQLRSEPPNPQVKVSPWQTTTIQPDTNRRPLEIGGCA
jgi:hypothetical protein